MKSQGEVAINSYGNQGDKRYSCKKNMTQKLTHNLNFVAFLILTIGDITVVEILAG